ncbi:MAG TPA: hypothetical protein VGQ47_01100, partial [Candidatus Limnocylindrales bacterium]|nr:hypothetical protein [Candidatus Limnocylindrales bacterium]
YAWPSAAAAGASGGRHARSRLGGTAAAMTFRGVGVSWYGMRGPDQGKANLLVDGAVVATVDTYASTSSLGLLRHVTGLTDAVHTVRIEVRGDKRAASTNTWVSLDRLTVD